MDFARDHRVLTDRASQGNFRLQRIAFGLFLADRMNGFRGVDLLIRSRWIGLGWKLWSFLFLFFGMKREEDHKESEAII